MMQAMADGELPKAEWYFEDAANVQRLCAALAELEGTPFRRHSRAPGPGGGMDCTAFCEYAFARAGAVEPFHFPRMDADYQSHRTPLRILDYLRGKVTDDPQSARLAERFAEIALPIPQGAAPEGEPLYWHDPEPEFFLPGDLLVLREAGQIHLPIIRRGRKFVHCMAPMGVEEGNLHDTTFTKFFVAMFRARAL